MRALGYALVVWLCAVPALAASHGGFVQIPGAGWGPPGPSAGWLANPSVYSCVRNFYVATTGNDSTGTGTQGSPWATVQHADTTALQAGDCINVAPGAYSFSTPFNPTHGGNSASLTGYITYRCQTLNGCLVTYAGANGDNGIWYATVPYLIIDGWDLNGGATGAYGGLAKSCITSSIADTTGSSHHLWIINNRLHDCQLSCIGTSDGEWHHAIHNEMFNCAWSNNFQGSGIGIVIPKVLGTGITQYPLYNSYTTQDNSYAPYRFLIAYNYIHDNGCTTCTGSSVTLSTTCNTHASLTLDGCASTTGVAFNQLVTGPLGSTCVQPFTYVNTIVSGTITLSRSETCTQNGLAITFTTLSGTHTDGNGIILDTFCAGSGHIPQDCYPYPTLVAFNDVQFNGGRGIHVFGVLGCDIVNNSMYRNGIDATGVGQFSELSHSGGNNCNYYGNIAYAVNTINTTACGGPCTFGLNAGDPSNLGGVNNVYSNNVLFATGGSSVKVLNNGETGNYVAANNKESIDPLYVNETSDVKGDLHLQAGSPARGYVFPFKPVLPLVNNAGAYQ